MPKPRLNKKQRKWVEKFKEYHPGTKISEIYEDLLGDRILILEWIEKLPQTLLPDCTDQGSGWIFHSLKVKLRIFGDPSYDAEHQYNTIYPHCDINYSIQLDKQGQFSLELPQLLNLKLPQNPVKLRAKRPLPNSVKHSKSLQLKLPISGIAFQLHQINLTKGGQITSEQELLLETVVYRNLDTGKEIHLPAAIIEILKNKQASPNEWENAIDLYQVAGAKGILAYLEGLDNLRQHFGTNQRLKVKSKEITTITEVVKVGHEPNP